MTTAGDTIRILIATDNHVGYNERDPVRGDDSWKTFHEIMCVAKDEDVDMVLLGGDLFHDNKPSRKSMYQVMRSLRMNCLGEKPCELEILSDPSTNFQGSFNHANYEDPDINIAIPVFSIHGNHDDPSGEGRLGALDILSVSGLLNYFGRTPENDNIVVNPVLLQKGRTKLAMYGMSNVRDERLFRTFRDGHVKFLRPNVQTDEWFNLMVLHQNHHAHTETSYLPENFLQEFLDVVVWGHEHECLIDPRRNPEMGFDVMQPGSSVATSLCEGESVQKHVCVMSITGRDYEIEKIRLKTVRPFVMKEMVLSEEKELKGWAMRTANRAKVTEYLKVAVEELINQAREEWVEAQGEGGDVSKEDAPLPLVRLRVEYTAPEGGHFETENPQRFSNRFVGMVANSNDVVQFYRKKAHAQRKKKIVDEIPEAVIRELGGDIENIKVEKLVQGFLETQSLSVLAENGLGDAISQFVDKDDRHAVEEFVKSSLKDQIRKLLECGVIEEHDITQKMEEQKSNLEELFSKGLYKSEKRGPSTKQRPDDWDSDENGSWEDQKASVDVDGDENLFFSDGAEEDSMPAPKKGRGAAKSQPKSQAKKAPAKPKATPARRGRAAATPVDEDEDDDMMEVDVEESPAPSRASRVKTTVAKKPTAAAAKKAAAAKQSTLSFASQAETTPKPMGRRLPFSQSQSQSQAPVKRQPARKTGGTKAKPIAIDEDDEDDDIIDDDDEEEYVAPKRGARKR